MIVVCTAYGLKAWKGSSSGTYRVSGYAESEQGLKPDCQGAVSARLKPCPDTNRGSESVVMATEQGLKLDE
jgi:hypothetical protein